MNPSHSLFYERFGTPSAPKVVFLHGFMGHSGDWKAIIERLASTYCCLAVHLPGHGKSLDLPKEEDYTLDGAARGVAQIMKKNQAIPAPVVGYSMGGRVALYLALHYSPCCSRLVVESATAGLKGDKDRAKRRERDQQQAQALRQGSFEDFLRTWYGQPLFETLAAAPDKLEEVLTQRRLNDPEELAKALEGMGVGSQDSLWEQLPRLTTPTLLIAGEKDSKYVAILRAMAKRLPSATIEIIAGAGHNVHLENARAAAAQIEQFLAKEQ